MTHRLGVWQFCITALNDHICEANMAGSLFFFCSFALKWIMIYHQKHIKGFTFKPCNNEHTNILPWLGFFSLEIIYFHYHFGGKMLLLIRQSPGWCPSFGCFVWKTILKPPEDFIEIIWNRQKQLWEAAGRKSIDDFSTNVPSSVRKSA